MACVLDAFMAEKETIKDYALQIGEQCIGTAVGGAIIAGITSILEISLLAANPIGAAALCGGLALSDYLNNKCVTYIWGKLDQNIRDEEACNSLKRLVSKVAIGIKMTFWILAATFAASYMGVPVVAGVFIFIGAGIALEGLKALRSSFLTCQDDKKEFHAYKFGSRLVQNSDIPSDDQTNISEGKSQAQYIVSSAYETV